ncbi:MAG: hypothetical protein ACREOI_25700 [bacterium]
MGTVNTTIRIRNILTNSDAVELESKIDTGATLHFTFATPPLCMNKISSD